MKRTLLTGAAFALVAQLYAAVDLTPIVGIREQDGLRFRQLIFKEGATIITYEHPTGWSYTGDANHIRFLPPHTSQAHADIEQAPLAAPQPFDEPAMKALREQVLASIPKEASQITVVSTEKNPLVMSGHETFEAVVSYHLYGTQFVTATLFMNLKETQLRFRVISRKEDFEKTHQLFRGSLYSWQTEENAKAGGE
jgi:hypothetical protein